MSSDAVERYREFLRATALDTALCWTVVEPVTRPVTIEEVVRRLGGDPSTIAPSAPDEVPPGHTAFHLHPAGSAVALLEVNDYQGSRPEVLRRLSDGARVHSAFWNVNAVSRLSYAVYGKVLASFEALPPPEDPGPLDGDLDDLFTGDDWQAALLAVVERRTGVVLDDWVSRPHPVAVLPPVPFDPQPPGFLGAADPDLDALLRLAPERARRAALRLLVSGVAATFDLADEPAVRAVVDALKTGFAEDELHYQALDGLQGGDRQRRQALAAIQLAVAPPGHWQDPLDAFYLASVALAERWPELRRQVRAIVRET
jgi:hypothetical protein